jgi:ribosomal protein S18 acetylase RimI-like enzyme
MAVSVERVDEVDDEVVAAFARLMPQLSRSAPPLDGGELSEIASSSATTVLVARDETGSIIGTLTLVLFRIPTGVRAWIEDVVVDESARGTGAGEALTNEAVRLAGQAGARTIELTSNPSREAANRLYRRLGFKARDTNVYRYELS